MNVKKNTEGYWSIICYCFSSVFGNCVVFNPYTYYCGCGNPVNDSDLCEGYTYDDKTKTITFNCIETTDEMITEIKVVKCDENSLHLDFNGEIRIFEK